ncbi:hypothetical protein PG987_010516 [Apiospora arundinis]
MQNPGETLYETSIKSALHSTLLGTAILLTCGRYITDTSMLSILAFIILKLKSSELYHDIYEQHLFWRQYHRAPGFFYGEEPKYAAAVALSVLVICRMGDLSGEFLT